jgi:hypothetical protein
MEVQMSDRITEEYRRHTLLSAFHGGHFKGRVWKDKKQLTEIEGSSIADVLNKLREFVDCQFVTIAAGRQTPTNSGEYISAFRNILKDLSDGHLAMLRAHYLAPNQCMTATQLADAAGYANYNAANLQYGNVGKALYEEYPLDIPCYDNGSPIYTFMIGTAGNKEADEREWVWKMRPEVVAALEELGLNN